MESALSNTADKSVRPKRKATERFQKTLKGEVRLFGDSFCRTV